MSVHFKFAHCVAFDSINVGGHFISVANLKDEIVKCKKMFHAPEIFDLLLTNAETREEYLDDTFLIRTNTSVIVKRVPIAVVCHGRINGGTSLPLTVVSIVKLKNDSDEAERISATASTSTCDWRGQMQSASIPRRLFGKAIPGKGYVCHCCGQPGHFIMHCPTKGDPTYNKRKFCQPVGIPTTRLILDENGSYIMSNGSFANFQPDEAVFAKEAEN